MNLGPNVWGPHLWKALHMITVGYPNEPTDEQKKNYKHFFENLHFVIPCSICANHYKEHLKELPLTDEIMKNRMNLSHWLIDVHNIVNKLGNKKQWSYDDALLHIFNNYKENENFSEEKNTKSESSSYPLWGLIAVLAILVTIAVVYKKH